MNLRDACRQGLVFFVWSQASSYFFPVSMLTYTSWLLAVASYLIEQVVSNFLLLLSVGSRSVFLKKVGNLVMYLYLYIFCSNAGVENNEVFE